MNKSNLKQQTSLSQVVGDNPANRFGAQTRCLGGSCRDGMVAARPSGAKRVLVTALAAMFVATCVWGQTASNPDTPDVTAMSLEDLMNLQVTSVSKHTQRVADAAAAVFVVTQEDIQRSGARNIPEALRMVPGIEVARIDENKWAISARGFNGRFADKLLVLIDGRSVYTPLFSGVYWDVQDVPLEDVDRIEVIRGPGATLWGANAVNGVINIITKPAKATQSGLVQVEGGNEQMTSDTVRYGDSVGGAGYYRAYAKYFDWGSSTGLAGQNAADGWHQFRGGFRSDWTLTQKDSLTVQGDIYNSREGETLTIPTLTGPNYSSTFQNVGHYIGGNLLTRWTRNTGSQTFSLQAYFDRTNFADNSLFIDHESVFDVDFQHDFHLGDMNEIVWGAGYRSIQDSNAPSFTVAVTPTHAQYNQFSMFVQDEISFFDSRMQVTLGSKFEHNAFTGWEYEPNARLLGNITKSQSVWIAVSRAVRTPALTEEGLRLNDAVIPPNTPPINSPIPVIEAVYGNPQYQSEDLVAYEIGYRLQATSSFSADIATFYNNYTNLRTAEPGTPFVEGGGTDYVIPFLAENKMSGGTWGVEPYFDWKVLPRWKLFGSYSFLKMNIHKDADSIDPTPDLPNGESPQNQWYIRSTLELPKHIEQNLIVRYVSNLPSLDVPAYASLDGGIRWRPIPTVAISFSGENWLNDRHTEFVPDFVNTLPTIVGRSYNLGITWTPEKR